MKNKIKSIIVLLILLICIIAVLLIILFKKENTFDDYTNYYNETPDIDTMFNQDLIPVQDKNTVEAYLLENKTELISKGVPEEFFESIDITMHNASVYTIIAGDKSISIGLDENGEVEYCNVY